MPSYGSLPSPSLRKMENGHGYGASRPSFSFGRIIGDPFALATISISVLAWIIAFVSSIIAATIPKSDFPNFAWWALTYMLLCIIGVTITIASDSTHTYHVAIVGFLSAGLVFTSSSVNSLVYSSNAAFEAGAAGFILMSMIAVIWVLYFGSQPQASHRAFVDSYALHKEAPRTSRQMSNAYSGRPDTSVTANPQQQMYTSAQLNGFETSSPVSGYPGGPVGGMDQRNSSQPRFGASNIPNTSQVQTPTDAQPADGQDPATEYPYRAKAIYSYEANPDDANEISFQKHDILEVSDVSGRWWQAKKPNGDTGIAPSNYLILL